MGRWIAGFLVTALFVTALAIAWASDSEVKTGKESYFDTGPMVQIGNTGGQTGIVICWRTAKKSSGEVNYWKYYDIKGPVSPKLEIAEPATSHEVTLKNLEPGIRYEYQVLSDGQLLGEGTFYTGKDVSQPFRFAVFGDSGSGLPRQYQVAQQVSLWQAELILHTGDLIYPRGEDKNYPAQFYQPYRNLLRRVFFMPSPGNHDYGTDDCGPWRKNFSLPGKELYYSFDFANAHFIALDSNRITDEQTSWLEKDLASSKSEWKFVYFHHPAFSVKKNRVDNEKIKASWQPLFEKYGVNIVFAGHDHLYARFRPINGVLYIVEGVGGKSLYEVSDDDARIEKSDNQQYGFGLVQVYGNWLQFYHISADGKILDTFKLNK